MRRFLMFLGIAFCTLLAGCGDRSVSRGEPFYRHGMALEARQNYAGAVQAYLVCLGRQPDHAAACYRLAYLNDSQIKDGTELAIHYYRHYLDLDPHGSDAQTVRRRLESMQKQYLEKLAATYPEAVPKAWSKKLASGYIPKAEAERQMQVLKRENEALRNDNIMLRQRNETIASKPVREPTETAKPPDTKPPEAKPPEAKPPEAKPPEAKPPETAKVPDSEPPTAVLPGLLRFHIVLANDNLSSISRKYYGSSRHWRLILDHNKTLLRGSEKNLQPGMRLEIPPLEEKPAPALEPVG